MDDTPPAPPPTELSWFWRQARKIVVGVIGSTVILLGILMLVLPGPGWLTIFGGLAILATEFAWAKWVLRRAREKVNSVMGLPPLPHDDEDETQPSTPAAPKQPGC